mgnify:CR=1 FL=1
MTFLTVADTSGPNVRRDNAARLMPGYGHTVTAETFSGGNPSHTEWDMSRDAFDDIGQKGSGPVNGKTFV